MNRKNDPQEEVFLEFLVFIVASFCVLVAGYVLAYMLWCAVSPNCSLQGLGL